MASLKKINSKKPAAPKAIPTEKEPPVSVQKVVKDERTHKITGFFLILIAIWLFIAFISYGFTWQQDQDKVFNAGPDFLFADDIKVDNKLGRLGAWISHVCIYNGFGLASYFLCILPFTLGVNLIFKKNIFHIWKNVFYAITGLVYFSISLAALTKGSAFSFGGGWGEYLSENLSAILGQTGMALLLIVLGVAWLVWRFNPVFRVPKAPKMPDITLPAFGGRKVDTIAGEGALLEVDSNLHKEKNRETIPAGLTGAEATVTYPDAATPNVPDKGLSTGTVSPATGLSINDLYAQGKEHELAKRRFRVEEQVNPLEQQTVTATGNHLEADDLPLTIVVPPADKPAQADPMTVFSVSDTPITDGSGQPVNLMDPIPPEKSAVAIVMPDTPSAQTTTIAGTAENRHSTPENNPGEAEHDDNMVVTIKTPVSKPSIPQVTAKPESDLELEIKPSAEENIDDAEESDSQTTPNKKIEKTEPYDPMLDLKGYQYPGLDLLDTHGSEKIVTDASELETHKTQILNTLKNYDISIQRISATVGPTVTLYEIVPAPGVRISRIKNLEDDIALSLAALGIRIIAPIPGKGTIGIEVPNVRKTVVSMRTLLASEKFQNTSFSLPIAIGKKIDNEHFVVDLASMPHLLMAGATGQGKSVGINAVLVSLLYKKHPAQLKLVLVDPKKVELSLYRAIEKHFLAKLPGEEEAIITDTKKVVHTLNALCIEMDNRYDLLKEAGVRNIKEYNEKFIKRRLNPERGHQYLPFIVLVIDEFADLIMTAGKEIEMPIARLAQLARAVGIHLIIATQRPSVNIITGTIKANFPSRVAFKVSSKIDSRTILDAGGAEQLIGKGDMLISHNGELIRLQCAFVDTPEVERVCEAIGRQRGYPEAFLLPEYVDEKDVESREFDINDRDSLFDEAARLIVHHQQGSTSLIQRRMKLGYNRAGRLMDQLEQAGIVGPNQGSKPRDVLVKSEMDLREILERF